MDACSPGLLPNGLERVFYKLSLELGFIKTDEQLLKDQH